jgi:hypothetical protein
MCVLSQHHSGERGVELCNNDVRVSYLAALGSKFFVTFRVLATLGFCLFFFQNAAICVYCAGVLLRQ